MSTLNVIIASTRPGRVGKPVGDWVFERAQRSGAFDDVVLTDLKHLDLPFLDEANHPNLQQYAQQHTVEWGQAVERSDAFVFVMPEYNHSFTAPLKNALDFLYKEWNFKPAGFVSYGGVSGGLRAVQQLRQTVAALRMFGLADAVPVPFVKNHIEGDRFVSNDVLDQSLSAMFNELARVAPVMAQLRN